MLKRQDLVLIEDDLTLAKVLSRALSANNYRVKTFHNGEEGLNQLLKDNHALAIVDISLPGVNGLKIVSTIREEGIKSPVIVITGLTFSDSEIKSYKNGASIFHRKPINLELLLMQMEALLNTHYDRSDIKLGDLVIQLDKRNVLKSGERIQLSPKEYLLLLILAQGKGKVFSRERLLTKTHSVLGDYEIGSIDTLVCRVRKKIGKYSNEQIIETVYRTGYRINPNLITSKK